MSFVSVGTAANDSLCGCGKVESLLASVFVVKAVSASATSLNLMGAVLHTRNSML